MWVPLPFSWFLRPLGECHAFHRFFRRLLTSSNVFAGVIATFTVLWMSVVVSDAV